MYQLLFLSILFFFFVPFVPFYISQKKECPFFLLSSVQGSNLPLFGNPGPTLPARNQKRVKINPIDDSAVNERWKEKEKEKRPEKLFALSGRFEERKNNEKYQFCRS